MSIIRSWYIRHGKHFMWREPCLHTHHGIYEIIVRLKAPWLGAVKSRLANDITNQLLYIPYSPGDIVCLIAEVCS